MVTLILELYRGNADVIKKAGAVLTGLHCVPYGLFSVLGTRQSWVCMLSPVASLNRIFCWRLTDTHSKEVVDDVRGAATGGEKALAVRAGLR